MTPSSPAFTGTPDEVADVAAALTAALSDERSRHGRGLDRYEVFAVMRTIAGTASWDAMPVPDGLGALRLLWRGPTVPAEECRYLLVTDEGRCYVEGVVPADPAHAAEYLAIRRRFLAALPPAEAPLFGSLEALAAQAEYEALVDRIADGVRCRNGPSAKR